MSADRLHRFERAEEFLALAADFLAAREAENNLMLGIAIQLAETPDLYREPPYLCVVAADGAVEAAALRTPPMPLVLSRADDRALGLIVKDLRSRTVALPAAVGPRDSVDRFARMWAEASSARYEIAMEQMIYQLTRVNDVGSVSGAFRRAKNDEADMLVEWGRRFIEDVGLEAHADAREMIGRMIDKGGLYVWDDRGVVSMANWGRPTRTGVTVNLVYTPPDLRGRGYATACVAALSRLLLDSGRERCFLYTDLANPTSNAIYRRIGYQPVCESAEYRFIE